MARYEVTTGFRGLGAAAGKSSQGGLSDDERRILAIGAATGPRAAELALRVVHAERFTVSGKTYVGAAVADVAELENQFAALIAVFSAAALVGLVTALAHELFRFRSAGADAPRPRQRRNRAVSSSAKPL